MSSLDAFTLPLAKKELFIPPLTEVAEVLSKGLKEYFQDVNVSVVDCPDLREQPFTLSSKGLGGNPQLLEVGGPPFLMPLVDRTKVYDLKNVADVLKLSTAFVIGAGAGPWPLKGANCEGIFNTTIENGKVNQQSRLSIIDPIGASKADGKCKHEIIPATETRFALLANFFVCEGKPGKVLKVDCKKRIGEDNYITAIRKTLENHYKNNYIGLGGTFLLKQGKAKLHVMPDFSKTPINSDEDTNNWLHFFNMSAPLINVGTLVTGDMGLDLRLQHFHCFSHHGEGGHYHYDTTPSEVEYEGYFNLGQTVVRLDAPIETHTFGRD